MEQHSPTNPFKSLQGISFQPYSRLMSTDEPGNYNIMLKTYLPDSPDTAIFFEDDEENNIQSDLHPVTKTIQKSIDLKKKYSNISNALRLELLDAVENQGEKIKHAARRLNINYSSAKSICQIYKREGRSSKKTFKRRGTKEEPLSEAYDGSGFIGASPSRDYSHRYMFQKSESDPSQTYESNPPEKDSLAVLRDRLIESRASSLKNPKGYEMPEEQQVFQDGYSYNTSNQPESTESGFSVPVNQQKETGLTYNQNNQFISNVQAPTQTQHINNYIMPSSSNNQEQQQQQQQPQYSQQQQQPVYTFPHPQMGPVLIASPHQMPMNNFNLPVQQQSVGPSGPQQTININRPQAKEMSVQSVQLSENKQNYPENSGTTTNFNHFSTQNFPPQQQQQQQQPQSQPQFQMLPLNYQNMAGGNQMQVFPSQPFYILPQGGNLQMAAFSPQFYGGQMSGAPFQQGYIMNYPQQQQSQPQQPTIMYVYGGNPMINRFQTISQEMKQKVFNHQNSTGMAEGGYSSFANNGQNVVSGNPEG